MPPVASTRRRHLLWLRRDLRLADHPALMHAVRQGPFAHEPAGGVDPADIDLMCVYVHEDLPGRQQAYVAESLRQLSSRMNGALVELSGDPARALIDICRQHHIDEVHITADVTPDGIKRDEGVREALATHDIPLIATGSPYAVAPDRVHSQQGTALKVFTPFYRAWRAHGWREPLPPPVDVHWWKPDLAGSTALPSPSADDAAVAAQWTAGEEAALERWEHFRQDRVDDYRENRDRPDLPGTSQLSVALRFGEIHPRTLLADLGEEPGQETFAKEIAWREFYADVLFHNPHSVTDSLHPEFDATYDPDDQISDRLTAWQEGRTGYPFVDAGMRQLTAEGWMHNRVRMVTASFLVKDLHIAWWWGEAWFRRLLLDGDVASNVHGWQWTAGCGTDAAPYFRVFNPVLQGKKFDPKGDYVRRYVPELRHLTGARVHEPWKYDRGDYPEPIVDHFHERDVSLARYQLIKNADKA